MTKSRKQPNGPLAVVEAALSALPDDASQLPAARTSLQSIADSANEAGQDDVARFASAVSGLIDLLEAQNGDGDSREISEFVCKGLGPLGHALNGDEEAAATIPEALATIEERWGEYLSLMGGTIESDDPWADALDEDQHDSWNDGSEESASENDRANIEQMLASLSSLTSGNSTPDDDTAPKATAQPRKRTKSARKKPEMFGKTDGAVPDAPPEPAAIEMDAEMLEAYAEDARAGASRLEQVAFELEGRPDDTALHQSVCRELHTLKGASASVGLMELGDYLHRVEDYVEGAKGQSVDVAPLLQSVDAVRKQLDVLAGGSADSSDDRGEQQQDASVTASAFEPTAGREESLRVKASRVDRLMDLLAELVILRNQRDSRLNRLKNLHSELTRCVTRLNVFHDGLESGLAIRPREAVSPGEPSPLDHASGSVAEIASDVAEFARSLRDLAEPMEAENITISHFIRQFRGELMDMRRMPVSGLFQRLNRAARDAARIEDKKIEFYLEGEHAGLDKSLQERLYEPLLHIVRNAVSHGVESPQERRKAGKPEAGTIKLSAYGSPTTLVIEITDDGRGLDFEAIRRRGLDRGLLSVGEAMEESRLARLIFHPGFSTRTEANAVAGRGVGMDVVAAALQRLRAKIDVDSKPGSGTTMRLTIPLRSVIEHAMVVRAADRLFAIPMQFVQAAGPLQTDERRQLVPLRNLLELGDREPNADEQMVILGSARLSASMTRKAGSSSDSGLALIVDDVIGPDEVVVRTLPALLKSHPSLGGVTLSGDGDIVQLLDGQRLMDLAQNYREPHAQPAQTGLQKPSRKDESTSPHNAVPALVADDSLSARRRLVKMLRAAGFKITEAGDGREAVDLFRDGDFKIVFTDLEMPNLDGFGVLSEIKGNTSVESVPVVVASSRAESEFRDRAAELGANDYLVKPVSASALAETLLKLESQYAPSVESAG